MNRKLIWISAGALVAVAAIVVYSRWSSARATLEYAGTVETREIQVGSKIGGRVVAVPVEEGKAVKAGTVLVRFECEELKAQREQAVAAADQAKAALDRMLRGNRPEEIVQADAVAKAQQAALDAAKNGPRAQEIEQAQADYAAAMADAANADAFYKRMQKLVVKDVISRQDFENAQNKRDSSEQRAESLRQRLDLLKAGTRVEDLHAAQAKAMQADAAATLARKGFRAEDIAAARGLLTQTQARVAEFDARLKEAELAAAADALVEVVGVRSGDLIPPGRIVVTLLEPSQLWVKVYIPETEIARVRVGQQAKVRIDGFSGREFTGNIEQIASQAEFLPRNVETREDRDHQVFAVKVHVDNPSGTLNSGMSATVNLQ